MYEDFTNLKKAYSKDGYPLSRINKSVQHCQKRSFELHRSLLRVLLITLSKEDHKKTTLIIDQGLFIRMPCSFGLNNVEAIYDLYPVY